VESEDADHENETGAVLSHTLSEPVKRCTEQWRHFMTVWINLREHWINLLHRAATGTRRTRMILTPVGILIFGVFTVLFVLAALLVDRQLGLPGLLPDGVKIAVSFSLLAVGISVTAWSAFHFVRVNGTPVPFNPPPKLVNSGPYRHARNPMLTGVFLFLFGLGFAFDSVSLVFVFTPLYILANVWELKRIEEPELIKRLGDEYIEYRNRTPMFIPSISR
jgi:protein-S-isoprenylcysteine O-methyltransferase Ste14